MPDRRRSALSRPTWRPTERSPYLGGQGLVPTPRPLVWVDRQDHEELIPVPPRPYMYPRISPDQTRVALHSRDEQLDLWVWDLARRTLTRLTFAPGQESGTVLDP